MRRKHIVAAVLAAVAALSAALVVAQAQGESKAEYAGAASCMCHADPIQKTWRDSKHARAFDLLKLAGQEKNVECLPCHTTGYNRGGYGAPGVTINLEGVQCEECHGPAGDHVSTMDKTKIDRAPSVSVCARCHQDFNIHGMP